MRRLARSHNYRNSFSLKLELVHDILARLHGLTTFRPIIKIICNGESLLQNITKHRTNQSKNVGEGISWSACALSNAILAAKTQRKSSAKCHAPLEICERNFSDKANINKAPRPSSDPSHSLSVCLVEL